MLCMRACYMPFYIILIKTCIILYIILLRNLYLYIARKGLMLILIFYIQHAQGLSSMITRRAYNNYILDPLGSYK